MLKKVDAGYRNKIIAMIVIPLLLCILGFAVFRETAIGNIPSIGRIMLIIGLIWLLFDWVFLDKLLMRNLKKMNQKHILSFEGLEFRPTYSFEDDWGYYYIDLSSSKFGAVRKYNPNEFQIFHAVQVANPTAHYRNLSGDKCTDKVYCQIFMDGTVFRMYTLDLGDRRARIDGPVVQGALQKASVIVSYFEQLIASE